MTLGFNPLSDTPISAVPESGAAGAYTLTASSGSYTLAGQAAALKSARLVTASVGAYLLTGQAASLKVGRSVTASAGSYTLLGQAAGFIRTYSLTATVGAYTLSGQAANLNAARVVAAATGAYTLAGNDAGLVYAPAGGYSLSAGAGSFVLVGNDAALALAAAGVGSEEDRATNLRIQRRRQKARELRRQYELEALREQEEAARIAAEAVAPFIVKGPEAGLGSEAREVGDAALPSAEIIDFARMAKDAAARAELTRAVNLAVQYQEEDEAFAMIAMAACVGMI